MKSRKWLGALLAGAMILTSTVGLVGCGKDSSDNSSSGNEASEKDKEQLLKLILVEPETLDPNKCQDSSSGTVLGATQEGLARVKIENGEEKIVPAGAESWTKSKDELVWTFKIRDYKWSDGKPVTAQNYVDSFLRLLKKDNAFGYAYLAYEVKGAKDYNLGKGKPEDVGVKAKDDKTFEVTLEKPTPYFEKKLAFYSFYPVRLDVIEKGGENWDTDISKQVYCGPYKIKEWTRNNSLTFEKNPEYWDANNVYIEKVEMRDIAEFSTQAQLFEGKDLDVTGGSQEFIEKWTKEAEKGSFAAIKKDDPSTWYLGFNQKTGGPSGLMKNEKIRKALALSFNREEYVDTLYGRFKPAYGYIPYSLHSGDKEYRKEVQEPLKADYDKYKGNKEELQKLFKEGLKELGKDVDDLKKIELSYITTGQSSGDRQKQEWWKQEIEKNLGITLKVEVLGDAKLYNQARKDFKYDIVQLGWGADFDDPISFLDMWDSKSGNNYVAFNNAKYDEILKKLDGEGDIAKRAELYKELETILIKEEAGIAPIFYKDRRSFIHNYVKDFQMPLFGTTYEWRWAYISGRNK